MVLRAHAEVTAIFEGMALVPPGLPLIMNWRPTGPPREPERAWLYGGVGHLPERRHDAGDVR